MNRPTILCNDCGYRTTNIYWCDKCMPDQVREESQADARITAAAPDLLNILSELVHAHHSSGPAHTTGRIELLLLQAKQIIAKAQGTRYE